MFVSRTACFIYRDEGSKLAKSVLKCVDYLDAFDLQGDYCIGEEFLVAY